MNSQLLTARPSRKLAALVGAATLSLGALFAAAPQAHAAGGCTFEASWGTPDTQAAAEVLRLVNEYRASKGLGSLVRSESLERSAVWKSGHMLQYGYMTHADPAPPAARGVRERLSDCGYRGNGWAENIARGYRNPEAVMQGWITSDGHRRNLENSSYTAIGIGVVSRPGSQTYWTQNFGQAGNDGQPVPGPGPAPAPPPAPSDPEPTPPRVDPVPPQSTPPVPAPAPPSTPAPPNTNGPSTTGPLKPAVTVPTRSRPVVIRRGAKLRKRARKTVRFAMGSRRSIRVVVKSLGGKGKRSVNVRLHCNGKRLDVARGKRGRSAVLKATAAAGRCAVIASAGPRRVKARITIVVRPG